MSIISYRGMHPSYLVHLLLALQILFLVSTAQAVEPRFYSSYLLRADGTSWYPTRQYGRLHKSYMDRTWNVMAYTDYGAVRLAISDDGYLWGDGQNKYGRLSPSEGEFPYTGSARILSKIDIKFKDLELGGTFAMGLDMEGNIWTWGTNELGVLGIDSGELRPPAPRQIPAQHKWKAIAAGIYHVLAIDENGGLWAWGSGEAGAIGDGEVLQRNTPTRIGMDSDWTFVVAGEQSSIAIKSNGTLWRWGKNIGEVGFVPSPIQVGTDSDWEYAEFLSMGFSRYQLFARKTDQTGWTVTNTGSDPIFFGKGVSKSRNRLLYGVDNSLWMSLYDKSGPSSGNYFPTEDTLLPYPVTKPQQISEDKDWQYIVGGSESAFAGRANGSVWRWGNYSIPGFVWEPKYMYSARPEHYLDNIHWIDVGYEHVIYIDGNRDIRLNGTNRWQTGTTVSYSSKNYGLLISDTSDWERVFSGESFFFALRSEGTLWGWGQYGWPSKVGYLGFGEENLDQHFSEMTEISEGVVWRSFAMSKHHMLGVQSDGTLWAWGNNEQGQVAAGADVDFVFKVEQVGSDTDWKTVHAGYQQSAAIKQDGTVWVWGNNDAGQLGVENVSTITFPTQMGSDDDWDSLEFGSKHTIALKTDRTLWAWGDNSIGQLGNGSMDSNVTDNHTPVQVGNDTNWSSFVAGDEHTVALKTDRSLWSWGNAVHGQVGNGVPNNPLVRLNQVPIWLTKPSLVGDIRPDDIEHILNKVCGNTAGIVDVPPSTPFSYTFEAEDPDGHEITYELGELPSWITYDVETHTIYGTPGVGDFGCIPVEINVDDGIASTQQKFNLMVNSEPTDIALSNHSLWQGSEVKQWDGGGYTQYIEVGRLSAIDADDYDEIKRLYNYTIVGGTGTDVFTIEGDILRFIGATLDPAAIPSFTLEIEATDLFHKRVRRTFTISVSQENGPPLDVYLTSNHVVENVNDPLNFYSEKNIGKLVGVGSEFGDALTYEITGGNTDKFELFVNSNAEFELHVNPEADFDYETQPMLSVQITVADSLGQSFSKDLSVLVDNVNEKPTDIGLSPNVVLEGNYTKSTVVGQLSVIDPDESDMHTYYIEGELDIFGASALFEIEGDSLKLRIDFQFDYETANSYKIPVKVIDGGNNVLIKTITLNIDNKNEPPLDIKLTLESVPEGFQDFDKAIGKLQTIDVDDAEGHKYEVSGPDASAFIIKEESLFFAPTTTLDTESKPFYEIDVTSTDPGGSSFLKRFKVNIENVNEPPEIVEIQNESVDYELGTIRFDLTLYDIDTDMKALVVTVSPTSGTVSITGDGGSRAIEIDGIDKNVESVSVIIEVSDGEFTTSSSYSFAVEVAKTASTGGIVEEMVPDSLNSEQEELETEENTMTTQTDAGVKETELESTSSTDDREKSGLLSIDWFALLIFLITIAIARITSTRQIIRK